LKNIPTTDQPLFTAAAAGRILNLKVKKANSEKSPHRGIYGKIYFVKNRAVFKKDEVAKRFKKSLFLRNYPHKL